MDGYNSNFNSEDSKNCIWMIEKFRLHTKHFDHAHHQFPAGYAEQKLIADRPDESLLDQKHLGQQVVVVQRNGAVVVDDQSGTLVRYVLQALHLVTVVDPALRIPHQRDDLPGRVPVVTWRGAERWCD